MIKNRIIKKSAIILAATVSTALLFEACAKKPSPGENPSGNIVIATKASKVELLVGGDNIVIDWSDGKKSNLDDALEYVESSGYFVFTHVYSGKDPHYISFTGNITKLDCGGINELTDLDVSGSTELTSLRCDFNQLTSLDVSKNAAVVELSITHNQLTTLDVSKNTALTHLNCSNNRLAKLNVSATALGNLDCENNQLTASALNDLFRELPDRTEIEGYKENPEIYVGYIRILGNPGDDDCDRSIAQKKGWRFMIRNVSLGKTKRHNTHVIPSGSPHRISSGSPHRLTAYEGAFI